MRIVQYESGGHVGCGVEAGGDVLRDRLRATRWR